MWILCWWASGIADCLHHEALQKIVWICKASSHFQCVLALGIGDVEHRILTSNFLTVLLCLYGTFTEWGFENFNAWSRKSIAFKLARQCVFPCRRSIGSVDYREERRWSSSRCSLVAYFVEQVGVTIEHSSVSSLNDRGIELNLYFRRFKAGMVQQDEVVQAMWRCATHLESYFTQLSKLMNWMKHCALFLVE